VWLYGLLNILRKECPDIIITTGNKRFVQNWMLYVMRLFGMFKLATFTHVYLHRTKNRIVSILESWYCLLEAKCLNDVILAYTDVEANYLLNRGVPHSRIFFVNNTLDVEGIRRIARSMAQMEADSICKAYDITSDKCIVFIGRLIPRKSPELLLVYFSEIFKRVPDSQLVIIGGGPMLDLLKARAQRLRISFTDELFDERKIAAIMRRCRFVFLPGYAGLTVNHAFAYSKPFVTFKRNDHSPEIHYLRHGGNGYLLNPDTLEENIALLTDLLTNDTTYARYIEVARRTADSLTLERMVGHFVEAIRTMADSKQD
jgi:glycosyltransferase involved in cell wall biosynthesis